MRDLFAMAAMHGFACEGAHQWPSPAHVAEGAYRWADAMIVARGAE